MLVGGLAGRPASAAVERVEILSRTAFADGHRFGAVGAYEKIRGRLHYAVDPESPHNAPIVDLDLAPRDGDGLVRFSGDFLLFRPAERGAGNATLLYDVTNRGRLTVFGIFNSVRSGNDPASLADAGNRFLFRQGYTLLMSGWNWDVPAASDGLSIDLPIARSPEGTPLTGSIAHEFHVPEPSRTAFIAGISARGYPLIDRAHAVLTVRDSPYAPRRLVPRGTWRFGRPDPNAAPASAPDLDPALGAAAEAGGDRGAATDAAGIASDRPQPPLVDRDVYVTADQPFQPDKIYELVATAAEPRVTGLGLAAIRDAVAHFRAAEPVETALIFGHSQSGRLIATMVHQGLHVDARGQSVFDAGYVRVAGAGKGSFNHRFAQTTRHFSQYEELIYPTDYFPFSATATVDPLTGRDAGLLDAARAIERRQMAAAPAGEGGPITGQAPGQTPGQTPGQRSAQGASSTPVGDPAPAGQGRSGPAAVGSGPAAGRSTPARRSAIPKLFFTNSSAEYWARAASLIHTTPLGRADLAPPADTVRVYAVLGAQHFHARWAERRGLRYCVTPIDKRPVARALLEHLRAWAQDGTAPPASRYPRVADGTLGRPAAYFEALPNALAPLRPDRPLMPPLLDHGPRFATTGIADRVPPVVMGTYRTLVPMPDGDGNDRGGVGLPHLAVPLGSHLGWNPRSLTTGGPAAISRWLGSFHPFAATRADRLADDDRRPSLGERYDGRGDFEARFRRAVEAFAEAGFVRREEIADIVADWTGLYDRVMARPDGALGCGYLSADDAL
ncbi:alpha/beta hydrolase domain-containing protein [Rhodothalassium salexigens]|uniref:alpha/beta hydrolase domain-containing protein n=1 Tax=Rhodothalassium salexigens TaxID=1086 RepID=UPI0019132C62